MNINDDDATLAPVGKVVGLHHVSVPVADVIRSSDWYHYVFAFDVRFILEEEDGIVGIILQHESGLTVALRHAPTQAEALRDYCPLSLCVGEHDDLRRWCDLLDDKSVAHSTILDGHLGWYVEVPDPDGIIVELHTYGLPTADEP